MDLHQLMKRFGSYSKSVCISISFAVLPITHATAEEPEDPYENLYQQSNFTLFESGQVKPLAISHKRKLLLALNTPDNRVEVFKIGSKDSLSYIKSVPVGLEPISIAIRNDREAWVVNHLSDSVSVISLRSGTADLVTTLQVGDEPSDVVFAGKDNERVFVTAAHRGQNTAFNDTLTTPGVGRADVWVFDADDVMSKETDQPISVVNLFTDTPRALTVSEDGTKVYAAGFKTGNQTTVIPHSVVTEHGGTPGPFVDHTGEAQPRTSLIVKYNGEAWVDEINRDWSEYIYLSLPDKDVFVIDADAEVPSLISGEDETDSYAAVGTILFNMATNPKNGNVYVSNLEAFNEKRFTGPGDFTGHSIQGKFIENRISVLKPNGQIVTTHLNPHIDYDNCCAPIPNAVNDKSLALPNAMVTDKKGENLYIAAYGSSKVAVLPTQALEAGSVLPNTESHIQLSGGGPAGMVLSKKEDVMYVLTRFDNAIKVIDLDSKAELSSYPLYNPEPSHVIAGRSLMYDANYTSSNGDSACASCHIFGDMDGLAWDLGNPDSMTQLNPSEVLLDFRLGPDGSRDFRAMKGPMVTQSMRGTANHGPMHWRGDRTGNLIEPDVQPDSGQFNEVEAFKQFNEAFTELMGRHERLTDEEMQTFADFALDMVYPPNPVRNLDNSLTADQTEGREFFFGPISDAFFNCNGCHTLDPEGNKEFGVKHPGFYGANGRYSNDVVVPQVMKIPHLRNQYQKVGMFGIAPAEGVLTDLPNGENLFMGDQIKGFGYGHDGTFDTVMRFIQDTVFEFRTSQFPGDPGNEGGFPLGEEGDILRRKVESFVLAFDSNLKPIVGQQQTLNNDNDLGRIELLQSQADQGACDLIAVNSKMGFLYSGDGEYLTGFDWYPSVSIGELKIISKFFSPLTFTCTPLGSGMRMALDRDLDGIMNYKDSVY